MYKCMSILLSVRQLFNQGQKCYVCIYSTKSDQRMRVTWKQNTIIYIAHILYVCMHDLIFSIFILSNLPHYTTLYWASFAYVYQSYGKMFCVSSENNKLESIEKYT